MPFTSLCANYCVKTTLPEGPSVQQIAYWRLVWERGLDTHPCGERYLAFYPPDLVVGPATGCPHLRCGAMGFKTLVVVHESVAWQELSDPLYPDVGAMVPPGSTVRHAVGRLRDRGLR